MLSGCKQMSCSLLGLKDVRKYTHKWHWKLSVAKKTMRQFMIFGSSILDPLDLP